MTSPNNGCEGDYLNSDLNAVNYLQKMKFIKCIQMNFSRLLNDDEMEEIKRI